MSRLLPALGLLAALGLLLISLRRTTSESPRAHDTPSQPHAESPAVTLLPTTVLTDQPHRREPAPTTPDPAPRAATPVHLDYALRVTRDGFPLAGVEIGNGPDDGRASPWGAFQSASPATQVQTTGALGHALFVGLPQGWTSFWIRTQDGPPVSFSDRVHAGQAGARHVPLGSAALVGRVLGSDGEPRPGAALCLLQVGLAGEAALWFSTTTDDEGRYAFEGLAGGPGRRVLLYPESLFEQPDPVVLAPGERRQLDLETLWFVPRPDEDREDGSDR